MLNLGVFLEALSDYRPAGNEPAVSSVVVDSRQAVPGSVFVAFRGEAADGHDFVPDAFRRGAVAALVEHVPSGETRWPVVDVRAGGVALPPEPPYYVRVDSTLRALQQVAKAWRGRFSPRVIAITGSVGKTSTKELASAVLSRCFRTLKSVGNQNNEIGLPLTLLNLTPEHQAAVVEMGMYAEGEIALLCDLARPQVGVVTMIAPVHLERLGSMDAIVRAKRELVEALPADGVAVLNKDDERVMSMAAHTRARVFTYGLDPSADLSAGNVVSMGLEGIRLTFSYQGETLNVGVPLLGRHSAHTALRAAAVGLVEGMSWDDIVSGLDAMTSQVRLVVVPGPRGSRLLDDSYNSSPDSALAALNLLADLDGRRVAVLGDMLELGEAEVAGHRLVGRRAADVADILIVVGRRARMIGEEALAVGMPAERVHLLEDTPAAIPLLEELVREGDIVLVKGSLGMRMDRIVTAFGGHS
jgi:UDP-N-acetylmuramoyl-tripeptide--D-alanyl-D-alanine ligase